MSSSQGLDAQTEANIKACRKIWPSYQELCKAFHPSRQQEFYQNKQYCISGPAPSMFVVSMVYGAQCAKSWLVEQIKDLSDYLGVKDKLNASQVFSTADVMMTTYGYMKISEFMLFFFMVKNGNVGDLFGSIDGRTLCKALSQFLIWRNVELGKIELQKKENELKSKSTGTPTLTIDEWNEVKESWIMWAGFMTPDTWNKF